jgi:hypothetical protein
VAEVNEGELLEQRQRSEWQQRSERLVCVAQLDAEGRAAVA